MTTMNEFQKSIKHGYRVTILVPNGIGRNGVEYKRKTGRAVMLSANGGWVLNIGGRHGTPAIATEKNTVYVKGNQIIPKKRAKRR